MEALVVVWWLWPMIGFGSDFFIVRNRRRISIKGRISAKKASELRVFLQDDFPENVRFAVAGTVIRGKSYRFKWAGRLSQGDQQRVRNMLIEVLG